MRRAPLLLAVMLLVGCADSPFTPSESREARRAQARWAAREFADYAFEYRSACFCPEELVRWSRVEVREGAVVVVRAVDTGMLIPAEHYGMWPTIEELFRRLLQRHDDEYLADVTATYDAVLGYPTFMSFTFDPGIMDAGGASYVRNLGPLE